MRKQIITALLTISVSVAIIAGCGTKKPLQTDNSVSSEQGSSVDEMEPSSDYSEYTPEAGTDPSGERENDGEGTASGTDMDAAGRELFKEVLDRYCDYAINGWDEDGEESYMFWHNTDGAMGLDDVGYYFCDLNNDGTPELIMGSVEPAYAEWPDIAYDVYASVDGEIIHLATSWERNRYYLCPDSSLLLTGSGGAGITSWEKLMWDGGDSLKTVKELVYDYDDYPDSPWLYGENGIELSEMQHLTEEEGTKLLDEWENDYTRIPVTPLREYAEAK